MAKIAIATNDAWDLESKRCLIHDIPLTYSRKQKAWYCTECLYASHLTYEAQKDAAKRYQQSEKGRAAEKKYEKTPGGKAAREKYLKSDKYKQRRKEYNERLKESLQIARHVLAEKATREQEVEKQRTETLAPLTQDIHEFIDTMGKMPRPSEVARWAKDAYKVDITVERATGLINRAAQRR